MQREQESLESKIDGDHIEIIVDGMAVEGRIIERNSRNIIVAITSPFEGIKKEAGIISMMSLLLYNFLGDHGDKTAASMLYDLYRFCNYAREHLEELKLALGNYYIAVQYEEQYEPVRQQKKRRIAELQRELKPLQKALKSDKMDRLTYDKLTEALYQERRDLREQVTIDSYEIYRECFKEFQDTPLKRMNQEEALKYINVLCMEKPELLSN